MKLEPDGSDEAAHRIFNNTYTVEPDGTHKHVHGANMAVRADAFLDAGGWSNRGLAEDQCLWRRLRCRGWRIASPSNSVVVTSARMRGRARGGFADTLRLQVEALRTRHAQAGAPAD